MFSGGRAETGDILHGRRLMMEGWMVGWLDGWMARYCSGPGCKHEYRGAGLAESWMALEHDIPQHSLLIFDILMGAELAVWI